MIALFLFFSIILCDYTPIPTFAKGDGFKFFVDEAKAVIKFDMYLDLSCPSCTEFWFNSFHDIYSYYFQNQTGGSGAGDLYATVHYMPNPFHIAAFPLLKTASYLERNKISQENMFLFLTEIFDNLDIVDNDVFKDLTQKEQYKVIFDLCLDKLGYKWNDYIQKMEKDQTIEQDARYHFKYSCSRGVTGTPTLMVNDVIVDDRESFAKWKDLFDELKNQY